MAGKRGRKKPGKRCDASPTKPAVIDTPQGPILVYRFAGGKVGIMHPPECRVLKRGETLTFRIK